MEQLSDLVNRARSGDVNAFGELVQATQGMAYAVALSVLHDRPSAQDAVQLSYLRAFRRLGDLHDASAFPGWLRRVVITIALNMRRSRRTTLLRLEDVADVPVLDEAETHWSEAQRQRLAIALLKLSPEDRQLCDRRYHGGWSIARLAGAAGVDDAAMRKRLQRLRDRLRREIEMAEQRQVAPGDIERDLPAKVVELLARPRLIDLPENPVGRIVELLRPVYSDFADVQLPEVVDVAAARDTVAGDAMYVGAHELHRIDERRILRYDLTLPLLLSVRYEGRPLRVWTAGKAYRACQADAMHLEAFHQAEVLWVDDRSVLDPWMMTGRVLQSADRVVPGRTIKIVPTEYAMCRQAWELEVEQDGRWSEVLAWGVFTDRIVSHLGGDPARHVAVGVGYGLERLAMLRYGIDDARKIEVASVA